MTTTTKSRIITVVIGDTHIGGSTALCPPTFKEHSARERETQIAHYNKAQAWLYENWRDYWAYVRQLVGIRGNSRKHRLVVVHLGDVVDGLHHRSPQVMQEVDDQILAAVDLLQPIADMSDWMGVCYGTDAHNGGAGAHEIAVASKIGAEHDWEFLLDVEGGATADVAHHGRAGQRGWTSAAAGYAVEVQLDYLKRGMKPPRYVFRGHNHILDDSGERVEGTRAIACPSWQLRTAFGYRVAANKKRSDIGGILLDGDTLDFSRARYKAEQSLTRTVRLSWE